MGKVGVGLRLVEDRGGGELRTIIVFGCSRRTGAGLWFCLDLVVETVVLERVCITCLAGSRTTCGMEHISLGRAYARKHAMPCMPENAKREPCNEAPRMLFVKVSMLGCKVFLNWKKRRKEDLENVCTMMLLEGYEVQRLQLAIHCPSRQQTETAAP